MESKVPEGRITKKIQIKQEASTSRDHDSLLKRQILKSQVQEDITDTDDENEQMEKENVHLKKSLRGENVRMNRLVKRKH